MSTYSTSSIPQGIAIYANATLFPVTAQDGEQAVAADTNTLYIYDTSVPGWQAVANPGAAIAIDALTGEVTATGPGVVAATISAGAVTNAKLAAMADNTVKGNKSGAPASPSDLALSDVAETVSSVLTITNGSKAVVSPANLTIQVKQSSSVQDGYLSSGDWISFNNAATDVSNATALATPSTIAKRDANADCDFNVLKIGAGTAAAPSLAYSGDLDTGLFFSGVNTLNLSTNGVERMRVDASGNVGIGSQSPNARLQVNNSGTQLGLSVYSTSSNNTAELYNQGTTNYTLALNSAANSALTGASIGGYFARGTLSSRAQTLSQDSLLSISASGYTGSGVAGISAAVVLSADENTQANAYGGQIVLATTPNSTPGGFPVPRVYVKNDGKVNIPGLTASQLLATDASKNLQSLTTATYPSLTEISYVKGVTSGIQSQLNAKVDSVSGSAPISSSGGTTPTISISQSGAATDGYLSSTDWNTFDSKQPPGNYITALTSDVTATGPGSVAATVAFVGGKTSSEVATSVTDTQNATALSTASTLMERDGSGETALDGLSLDGSTSGAIKLQAAATTTNYTVKLPSAQGAASTFLQNDGSGNLSWTAPSTLPSQTGNQYKVLATDGSAASWQFAGLGDGSYPSNTVVLGRGLPSLMTATSSVLIGTGSNLGTGTSQVIIGASSGRSTTGATGANNTVIGADSFNGASLTTAFDNVIIGKGSGKAITVAQQHVIIGASCGTGVTSAYQSVLIGDHSAGNYNGIVAIGWKSSGNGVTGGNSVRVGFRGSSTGNSVSIGDAADAGSGCVAVGVSASANTTNSVAVGISASAFGATNSVSIGNSAKTVNSTESIAIGYLSGGDSNGIGNYNTSIGAYAGGLMNASATRNINLGRYAGYRSTTQTDELFIDNQDRTTYANQQTNSLIYGVFNATPASQTLKFNAATTSTYGLIANEIGGDYDSRIEGDTDQNLVFVDASTDRVGIGTATPSEKLEVSGNILASEVAVANYKLSPKVHDEGTETGNFTINWANSPVQLVTLNGTTNAVVTLSNPVTGGAYALKIVQGATPGTIDFTAGSFANVKWPGGTPPTLSGTTGDIDLINLLYIGTTYYGTFALDFA